MTPPPQAKRRRRVSRPPLGTKRSHGVTASVQGSSAPFCTVYCTATVFWPYAIATRRVTRTPSASYTQRGAAASNSARCRQPSSPGASVRSWVERNTLCSPTVSVSPKRCTRSSRSAGGVVQAISSAWSPRVADHAADSAQ